MTQNYPDRLPREIATLFTITAVILAIVFPCLSTIGTGFALLGGAAVYVASRGGREALGTQTHEKSFKIDLKDSSQAALRNDQQQSGQAQSRHNKAFGDGIAPSSQNSASAESPQHNRLEGATPVTYSASKEIGKSETAVSLTTLPAVSSPANLGQSRAPALVGGAAVLARLRQQRGTKPAMQQTQKSVVIAYASQTGTAQEIAKDIQANSAAQGIPAKVMSLNELGFENVNAGKVQTLVLVAASTGDGDAPDNSAKFYATLRKRTQEPGILKGVKFTCLGLGDSNYTRFMGVSRALRSRFQELGAEVFYKMAEADEVDGLESVVDPWVAGLWDALRAVTAGNKGGDTLQSEEKPKGSAGAPALPACRINLRWLGDATDTSGVSTSGSAGPTDAELAFREPRGLYTSETPFWAPVIAARYLTASTSDRKVLHLEFGLSGSNLEYQPGDSLGVSPLNEDSLVDRLLERLGADGRRAFEVVASDGSASRGLLPHLCWPCALRDALRWGCDLTTPPRKSLLRLLAEHCTDAGQKQQLLHLCSRDGKSDYAELVGLSPSVLDLLGRFPSCQPPLPALLDALPPLAPRLYSLASSPLQHPDAAHVAFSVVRIGNPEPNVALPYPDQNHDPGTASLANGSPCLGRWGVATGWLERLVEPFLRSEKAAEVKVAVHLRKGGAFKHPDNLSAPVIMIGPGTGVTPFRGFLQHRRRQLEKGSAHPGPAWLYFGCRGPKEDYLYGDEFESFAADGTLSRLETAFSRAGQEKVYVQDLMRKQARELCALLLEDSCFVFVCGDGAKMAKDVHACLLSMLEAQGGLSSSEAAQLLAARTKCGQYVRDIWS